MIISELIKQLEILKNKHGDLGVGIEHPEFFSYNEIEFVEIKTRNIVNSFSCDSENLSSEFVGIS